MKKYAPDVFFVWLMLSFITFGGLNADVQFGGYDKGCYSNNSDRPVKKFGQTMLWAALPPMWFATPFVTGFYANGWSLKMNYCKFVPTSGGELHAPLTVSPMTRSPPGPASSLTIPYNGPGELK